MSSNAFSVPNPGNPDYPIFFVNLSQCKPLETINNTTNYTQWSSQIKSFLFGFGLYDYLTGDNKCPPPTIKKDQAVTPNPNHASWSRQDQLLLGSLIGTLDAKIASLVATAETSHDAWTALQSLYANPTRSHILQVKKRLDSIKKTPDQTITDYMHQIKQCTIELANLGKTLDPEDIIAKVLNGLDPIQHRSIIETVEARDTIISFDASMKNSYIMNSQNSIPLPTSTHQHLLLPLQLPSTPIFQRQQPPSLNILSSPLFITQHQIP